MKKQTTIAEANYKVVLAIKDLNIESSFAFKILFFMIKNKRIL